MTAIAPGIPEYLTTGEVAGLYGVTGGIPPRRGRS